MVLDANKLKRIAFAQAGLNRSNEEWHCWLWTDEVSARYDYGQTFVTRKADEKFNTDCLVPKFRQYSAGMFWGIISYHVRGDLILIGPPGTKITT
jgi:transposase